MLIDSIINGDDVRKEISNILKKIHAHGPVHIGDLEVLSYIKIFQPDIFSKYEPTVISLMGLFYKTGQPSDFLEQVYNIFSQTIEDTFGRKFTPVQADAYKNIADKKYFSFSAPTSAGKSHLFREIIKESQRDIIIVVPSRALLAEYISIITKIVDKSVLVLQFIEVVNTAHTTRRIFVITPERSPELFKNLNQLDIGLFLFDEAQISEEGIRGMKFDAFVRRVDKLLPDAKKVFTHPFIENPEAQLQKHNLENNNQARAKNYKQNSVGKIFLSYKRNVFTYFSPYNLINSKFTTKKDVVAEALYKNGTVLIYVSKAKIYDGTYITDFADYIEICPNLENPDALKYITKLNEYIGASEKDGRDSMMIKMMRKGIVIHHGSMPLKARLIIEEFVNRGFAKICFSTSTLLQGVNMPFDIVWISNFKFDGTDDEKKLKLKNLIGRAGRNTDFEDRFDYGYVIIEEKNVATFSDRIISQSFISPISLLDHELGTLDEDKVDIVEAIKEDTFNDDLQLTDTQVERIRVADIEKDIKFILDNLIIFDKPISAKEYYALENTTRVKIKKSFKNIYTSHLRRGELQPSEASVLSAALPILLWQIQGQSFAQTIALRYVFLTEDVKRRTILRLVKKGELTPSEAKSELEKLTIRYSAAAETLPNKSLKAHGLFPKGTRVSDFEYDKLVYDTYDYLDKVISLSLKDPMSAAFALYYSKTGDVRADQLSNYIKFGTSDTKKIWLVRYGFSFDDIEWIKDYVTKIDESEIIFSENVSKLDPDKKKIIERFLN